jgi:hypothetical protein
MKPLIARIVVICTMCLSACSLAIAQAGGPGDGNKRCSNRTLSGDYGGLIEGSIYFPNPPDPPTKVDLRTISLEHYDGRQNITFRDQVVFGGNPPDEEWGSTTGTYVVNPDCTGVFHVYTGPDTPTIDVYFVIVDEGKEIRGVTNGSAITYNARKLN